MKPGLRAEIFRFFLIALGVLLWGGYYGYFSEALIAYLFVYIGWIFWSSSKFTSWIGKDTNAGFFMSKSFWADIEQETTRKQARRITHIKEMRKSVSKISRLTHTLGSGILVLNKDFKLDWWNAAASKKLNLQASDLGRPLNHLIRDPSFIEYLKQEEYKTSIELPSFFQPNQWLLFSAAHFGDNDIVIELADITRLKNMETLRKEFVGNVSHELRTPITVLRGYLETLQDGVIIDSPVVQKACKQMSEQVMRMQGLADDLIILSRLESEPKNVKAELIRLKPLLQQIVNEARVIGESNHTIALSCSSHASLVAQERELHSAISNLIINAVRHNPLGANIIVNVFSNDKSLEISVKDDGVGISSSAIPRLTERFYRTDSSRNSNVGGTGLGLAIVKHVINRYGGELIIKSRLGEGSEFICRFSIPNSF